MKITKLLFVLSALLSIFACNQPGMRSSPAVKLPATEQGYVDQFRHAVTLIPDSLDDDRKKFLEDSLKTVIDDWLSKKTGLKADRWLGVVMNDTLGQSFGAGHGDVLQLYVPVPKGSDTASARYDFTRSITLTMSVDEDDANMMKARADFADGDTIVFSGYFTPMSDRIDISGTPGRFLASPSLDFTPTELYKKGPAAPPVRPDPDTAGLAKAPVRVTTRMTVKNVSGGRFLHFWVTVKNISDKPITRTTARWQVVTKTGQPAKVDGATGIWLPAYFNQELAPGESTTDEWQHESPDGEKVQLAFPKSVKFYNGLKWNIGKH